MAMRSVTGALALTTGSRPRLLPEAIGGALPGVYPVRTLGDVDAMAAEFEAGRRVVIIGGGYIGLEAAAVAAQRGLSVVVVEMAPRLLARVAAAETAAYFQALHERHGVEIRTGVGLARLEAGEDGRVGAAVLTDGSTIAVDFALVGVGIQPNAELAEAAGLDIDNGVAVDAQGRTSDPNIFAAGDCASFPYRGARLRLESVQNAIDQAAVAARAMLGDDAAYAPTPWFWSDQYDVEAPNRRAQPRFRPHAPETRTRRAKPVDLVFPGRAFSRRRRDERPAGLYDGQALARGRTIAAPGSSRRPRRRSQEFDLERNEDKWRPVIRPIAR